MQRHLKKYHGAQVVVSLVRHIVLDFAHILVCFEEDTPDLDNRVTRRSPGSLVGALWSLSNAKPAKPCGCQSSPASDLPVFYNIRSCNLRANLSMADQKGLGLDSGSSALECFPFATGMMNLEIPFVARRNNPLSMPRTRPYTCSNTAHPGKSQPR